MTCRKENCACSKCVSCRPNVNINKSLARSDPYALYSKGLPHDSNGFVNMSEYCKYIKALSDNDIRKLNNVTKGGSLKQLDTGAAWNSDVPEISKHMNLKTVPTLKSNAYAANIVEIYDMALCRDVLFSNYATDPLILNAINSLSQLTEYDGPPITNTTIFRGLSQGDVIGPYISQFLYISYLESGLIIRDQLKPSYGGPDFMITFTNAVSVQNGTVLEGYGISTSPQYILNGRDLATIVKNDEPYAPFYRAALILYTLGIGQNADLPVNANIEPLINFGKVDVLTSIATVCRKAMLACWCHKNKALFIRPEEGGIIVERQRLGIANNPDISLEITNNPVLASIFALNGNYLLPQAYPEGCPASPSWPSEHATIAGAASIILKFFFNTSASMTLLEPDVLGTSLINSGFNSTIHNEINKLVSNCAYGRCWAGVNYRLDVIKGIKLGETVALEYLKNHVASYSQKVKVTLRTYKNKEVVIEN